jgi:hypothetical protein
MWEHLVITELPGRSTYSNTKTITKLKAIEPRTTAITARFSGFELYKILIDICSIIPLPFLVALQAF